MAESSLISPSKKKTLPPGSVLYWPPERFRYDMREAEAREALQKMDVAGRARHLVWGPYEVLPAGRWRAVAQLGFDKWACRHKYYFEFGAVADFTRHEFCPGREGVFEFDAQHVWNKASKVELRIVMIESSLGGRFDFMGAQVERLA